MFYDTSVYRGRYVTQCNQVIPDTFLRLTTGFDDVTITVTWAPVNADSSEAIAAAKTAAKAIWPPSWRSTSTATRITTTSRTPMTTA